MVKCGLSLALGQWSVFSVNLTRKADLQMRCVCEDIPRQDSPRTKTNPGYGWTTPWARNSKGMKGVWEVGGGSGEIEPARSQHPFVSVYQQQSLSHTYPLPWCSAKCTGPRDHGPNSLTSLAKITLPLFMLVSDILQCKRNQHTFHWCYCPYLPVVTW